MKRTVLALLSWLGVNAIFRMLNRGRIKILVYHNVTPGRRAFANAITPQEFEAHLNHLKRHYSVVSLTQEGAWRGFDPHRVNVLITFDDGFVNNYVYALPLLRKCGLTACFFLVADCVDSGAVPRFADRYGDAMGDSSAYRTIDSAMAKEMLAAGMTIGSHSLEHRDYTTLTQDEAVNDGKASQTKLGELLDAPVRILALPWGRSTTAQLEGLRTCFTRIFTTNHGFSLPSDWLLRRNEVAGTHHLFAAASGSLDWLAGRAH